ncbi:MAG: glycosyltransferase family 39 protein [Nitrososphaerales archaeon]
MGLAILLLAFALRAYRLGAQSLWYDEAVSAQVAAKGLAELTRWTANDIQPPLYYYLLSGWTRLAGHSEWAVRFPSVAFGLLGVALLWAVGRRIFSGRVRLTLPAALVASLAAISPLYVYYSQEARMYTQLVFFGMLAGYALWRAVEANRWGWWAAFVLASLAALYTHYFALFLLVAYGLCAILALLPGFAQSNLTGSDLTGFRNLSGLGAGRAGRHWVALVASFVLIGVGYVPWLPAMLTRYRVDASYWQGALKLGEALRHIAINFTTGAAETMLEADAVRWLPWFGLALVVALAGLLLTPWRSRAGLLLVVLLVPIALILMLASRNPKFNPRYLMLASPAYFLLLAGGAAAWFTRAMQGRLGLAAVPALILAPVLVTSVAGVGNWFGDPAFTKAQWREVAAYVRSQIGTGERVVLVSGHAAPAWDYYAADIPPLRLPQIDVLDVNAVLGFDSGADLAEGLSGRDGAWLVEWQNEVVDPAGFAPYFLDHAGRELPVDRSFWHIGLRHWQLRPDASYPAQPQPQHEQGANFDHKLELLGWDDPVQGQLTVYWRALNTLPADYQVSLVLEDAHGTQLGRWDGRPAGYDYPATRWPVGKALFGRYPLPLPAGAQGDHYVSLAVYAPGAPDGLDIRDVADNPAGKRVRLGPIPVASQP